MDNELEISANELGYLRFGVALLLAGMQASTVDEEDPTILITVDDLFTPVSPFQITSFRSMAVPSLPSVPAKDWSTVTTISWFLFVIVVVGIFAFGLASAFRFVSG